MYLNVAVAVRKSLSVPVTSNPIVDKLVGHNPLNTTSKFDRLLLFKTNIVPSDYLYSSFFVLTFLFAVLKVDLSDTPDGAPNPIIQLCNSI